MLWQNDSHILVDQKVIQLSPKSLSPVDNGNKHRDAHPDIIQRDWDTFGHTPLSRM